MAHTVLVAVFVAADADEQRLIVVDEAHQHPHHEAASAEELVGPNLAHGREMTTGLDAVPNVGQDRASAVLSQVLNPIDQLGRDDPGQGCQPGPEVWMLNDYGHKPQNST